MLNRRRNLLISIASAVLSCLLVYGVYILQLRQVELQKTIDVAVPKQFIDAGVMIAAKHIEYKAIFTASYDERMFTDLSELIGKETGIALGKGEPILDWKLNKFNLLPNQDQSTFQIPKAYVLSISNGIRAGDKVTIYVSSANEKEKSRRLFEDNIVVASVKSASNLEIDNVDNSSLHSKVNNDMENLYASRRDANAVTEHINLNLTEEQWLLIDRICRNGNSKLVIALSSSYSIPEEFMLKEEG